MIRLSARKRGSTYRGTTKAVKITRLYLRCAYYEPIIPEHKVVIGSETYGWVNGGSGGGCSKRTGKCIETFRMSRIGGLCRICVDKVRNKTP